MSPAMELEIEDLVDFDGSVPCEIIDYATGVFCDKPSVSRVRGYCFSCDYTNRWIFICAEDLDLFRAGYIGCSKCTRGVV